MLLFDIFVMLSIFLCKVFAKAFKVKRIGLIHATPSMCGKKPSEFLSVEESFQQHAGTDNLGNIVLMTGPPKLLDISKIHYECLDDLWKLSENYLRTFDAFFVHFTNLIYDANLVKSTDKEAIALAGTCSSWQYALDRIKITTPFLIFSVGCQKSLDNIELRVPDSIFSLFRSLEQRNNTITVRGIGTYRSLVSAGLTNLKVMGCSSILLNHNPHLGILIGKKYDEFYRRRDYNSAIAVNLPSYAGSWNDVVTLLIIDKIISILTSFPNSKVIYQHTHDPELLKFICKRGNFTLSSHRIVYYYTYKKWLHEMKQFEFLFSFRYHGATMAILAEVPTLLIATDKRIYEMATVARLRYVPTPYLNDANPDIFQMLESLPFNGEEFDRNRKVLANDYNELLSSYHLPINPGIVRLMNTD